MDKIYNGEGKLDQFVQAIFSGQPIPGYQWWHASSHCCSCGCTRGAADVHQIPQRRWRLLKQLRSQDFDIWLWINTYYCNRRKFRSQTSDNMERWKAEQGRGREKRKIRREKIRRERVRRQKMQMREKVGKSRSTVFFQWFVAPEGRKVGSLKRRVRSQLARREMKNCTPLWCEAHFEVKMYKTHHSRTTFGSCDVKKVHAVVARSTFRSQYVQNTPALGSGPHLKVEMSKKCTPLWREAHFEVKMCKTHHARTTFGGSDVEKVSKKCTPLWREAHLEVKSVKNWGFWAFFDVLMSKK